MESLRLRHIFLHYFDIHFLEANGNYQKGLPTRKLVKNEARMATRFALLSAECVYLPAASFFESDLCSEIIGELEDIFPDGRILLVGGGFNAQEFIETKLIQYNKGSREF
jgi:hypothetical protein